MTKEEIRGGRSSPGPTIIHKQNESTLTAMLTWEALSNLLPITVTAAVGLFLVKETLELFKRRNSDLMKRKAIRTMLAHEIEINHFAFSRITDILKEMKAVLETNHDENIENYLNILYDVNGRPRLKITRENGWSSTPIPTASDTFINRYIMEIALVDKKVFEKALRTMESVAQVNHIRDSIIDNVTAPLMDDKLGFLISFTDYGLEEINDAIRALEQLYRACTARALDNWKVR